MPSNVHDQYDKPFRERHQISVLGFVARLKRLIFLVGNPGVGKTTILLKTVESLKVKGYSVGGMISREIRSREARIGFEIVDLSNGKRGWLAHVNQPTDPQVGRYRVNLRDLNDVGATAIEEASKSFDIITIDEIGPMELFSENFRNAVETAIRSNKLVIGVVHWKAKDKLIDKIEAMEECEILTVTYENRDKLSQIIVEKAQRFLNQTGSLEKK